MACVSSCIWSVRNQWRKVAMAQVQQDMNKSQNTVTTLAACVAAMHKISGLVIPDDVVQVIMAEDEVAALVVDNMLLRSPH